MPNITHTIAHSGITVDVLEHHEKSYQQLQQAAGMFTGYDVFSELSSDIIYQGHKPPMLVVEIENPVHLEEAVSMVETVCLLSGLVAGKPVKSFIDTYAIAIYGAREDVPHAHKTDLMKKEEREQGDNASTPGVDPTQVI